MGWIPAPEVLLSNEKVCTLALPAHVLLAMNNYCCRDCMPTSFPPEHRDKEHSWFISKHLIRSIGYLFAKKLESKENPGEEEGGLQDCDMHDLSRVSFKPSLFNHGFEKLNIGTIPKVPEALQDVLRNEALSEQNAREVRRSFKGLSIALDFKKLSFVESP